MSIEGPQKSEAPKVEDEAGNEPEEKSLEDFEKDLSHETVEQIMAKVQDVRAYGTTFTIVDHLERDKSQHLTPKLQRGALNKVLADGVLGTPRAKFATEKTTPENWKKWIKNGDEPLVFFNILGRTDTTVSYPPGFDKIVSFDPHSHIGRNYKAGDGSIAVVFELNPEKELAPTQQEYESKGEKPHELKAGHHKGLHVLSKKGNSWEESFGNKTPKEVAEGGLHKSSQYEGIMSENGHTVIFNEIGFIASPRIAPRKFKGIVLQLRGSQFDPYAMQKLEEEKLKQKSELELYEDQKEKERIDAIVSELAHLEINIDKDKPERLLPIYDNAGNLLWPEKMNHEEVKKFVEERDKGKGEAEPESMDIVSP